MTNEFIEIDEKKSLEYSLSQSAFHHFRETMLPIQALSTLHPLHLLRFLYSSDLLSVPPPQLAVGRAIMHHRDDFDHYLNQYALQPRYHT
jgi:hypothetical protein